MTNKELTKYGIDKNCKSVKNSVDRQERLGMYPKKKSKYRSVVTVTRLA